MTRFKLIPTSLVMAAALLFTPASAVLAGGWTIVTLDALPTAITAGEEVRVGFTVLQHGKHPAAGLTPTVRLHHVAGNDAVAVPAVADGPKGHYAARFVLPKDAFNLDTPLPSLIPFCRQGLCGLGNREPKDADERTRAHPFMVRRAHHERLCAPPCCLLSHGGVRSPRARRRG